MSQTWDYFRSSNWRDLLRPIRDGIRDGLDNIRDNVGLNPTDPKEEQKKLLKRYEDRLRGFAYFETFSEIHAWDASDVDSLQQSTFPLLERPSEQGSGEKTRAGAKLLVCHDFAGGYHPYEAISPSRVEEESFSLTYLQHIETFIYFSHRLVTIPPAAWTNTLHRNGVKSLGTFIIEPGTKKAEEVIQYKLNSNNTKYFPIADKLAQMVHAYKFDGWLINIEKEFARGSWDLDAMTGFLKYLKNKLGPKHTLVWYDSLTRNGQVRYQNSLTTSNLVYFEICGNMLTNYAWDPSLIELSKSLAQQNGQQPNNIYFGIDVWAQNKPEDKLHPRITYPRNTGGGTNTGVAVAECRQRGVSAGIFGPAWCWEHFKKPFNGSQASQSLWQGVPLPKNVECTCYDGRANSAHCHFTGHLDAAIIKSASEFYAGTESFFWTEFSRAFVKKVQRLRDSASEERLTAQLGSQSVLPRFWRAPDESQYDRLLLELQDSPSRAVISLPSNPNRPGPYTSMSYLDLFELNLKLPHKSTEHKVLTWIIDYEIIANPFDLDVRFTVVPSYPVYRTSGKVCVLQKGRKRSQIRMSRLCHDVKQSARHLSIEVYRQKGFTLPVKPTEILNIYQISAMYEDWTDDSTISEVEISLTSEKLKTPGITNLGIDDRKAALVPHIRLHWTLNDAAFLGPRDGLHHPTSEMTGAMSHFNVYIDGVFIARVYGLEMVLAEESAGKYCAQGISVRIDCVRFGGAVYRGRTEKITLADAEWVVLDAREAQVEDVVG